MIERGIGYDHTTRKAPYFEELDKYHMVAWWRHHTNKAGKVVSPVHRFLIYSLPVAILSRNYTRISITQAPKKEKRHVYLDTRFFKGGVCPARSWQFTNRHVHKSLENNAK